MDTKIIAMYLPQYHEIPENNDFWGKGFTDWVGVKRAEPLYKGHRQPNVPLNENYYDLSDQNHIRWQAELANRYGVYGFGIYHYWFSSEKQLLTKPAEIILHDRSINIPFLFAWDNISWRRTWSKMKGNAWSPLQDEEKKRQGPELLVEYKLGDEEEWKKHFEYLLPYFRDKRYIKTGNKPVFLIYHYDENIFRMEKYWNELAKSKGFDGVEIIYRYDAARKMEPGHSAFLYEPIYSGWGSVTRRAYERVVNTVCEKIQTERKLRVYAYERVWEKIIKNAKKHKAMYSGAFVTYDDTPRRGRRGVVVEGAKDEKFSSYMKKLIEITNKKKKRFIFLTAWNEWGEGAYLEPDEANGYAYLEALKRAIDSCSE